MVGNSPLNVVGQYHHAVDPHLVLMDAINDLRKKEMSALGIIDPDLEHDEEGSQHHNNNDEVPHHRPKKATRRPSLTSGDSSFSFLSRSKKLEVRAGATGGSEQQQSQPQPAAASKGEVAFPTSPETDSK